MATDVQQHVEDEGKSCIALGAGMMLVGILLSFIWAWLSFFSRSKSPRNGITGGSGQVGKQLSAVIFCTANFILPEAICSLVRSIRSFLYLMYALL